MLFASNANFVSASNPVFKRGNSGAFNYNNNGNAK